MSIVILGIDLGKNSCSVVGLDESGTVLVRRRMRRDGVIAFAEKLSPCIMAMEACCGAHHMGDRWRHWAISGTVRSFVREAMMMRRRIIIWQSRKNYWPGCWPAATRTRCFRGTVCSTI